MDVLPSIQYSHMWLKKSGVFGLASGSLRAVRSLVSTERGCDYLVGPGVGPSARRHSFRGHCSLREYLAVAGQDAHARITAAHGRRTELDFEFVTMEITVIASKLGRKIARYSLAEPIGEADSFVVPCRSPSAVQLGCAQAQG